MSEAEVKRAQKQELEQITLPPEVVPKVEEKVPLPKKEFAGLSLGEILGAGLGISTNTPLMDAERWVIKMCGGNDPEICLIERINNVEAIANTNIAGLVEGAERAPFEQSKFYKDIVSNMEAALVPYTKAIAFDLVNLAADLGLIAATKGKYRKAFMVKAGVDAGLLAKNIGLRQYVISRSRGIIMSVARPESNPYPSEGDAIKAVYSMKDQQLIPFLQYMKQVGELQLPVDIAISLGVGIALILWAYISTKKEKRSIREYATDIV